MLIDHWLKTKLSKCFTFLSVALLFTISCLAQDSTGANKKWKILQEVYLMFPNISGTSGMGNLPDATIDANPGDVFSHLQFGIMGYAEMSKGAWSISTDISYMHLKQDVKQNVFINSGEINAKQFCWELAGLRKVSPMFEVGVGTRLNNMKNELDLVTNNIVGGGTTARNKSITKTWVDPILIARLKGTAGKKFIYQFRGDLGGFGIGSDFTWQIQAYGGWRFSKLFQFTAGYRVISIDYNKGSGEDRFLFDMNTFGPVIRFGFNL